MLNRRTSRGLAAALACLATLGAILVLFPREILTTTSSPQPADYLVVLGGDAKSRALHAAELFSSNLAPMILVSGIGDGDLACKILKANGVPESAIQRESRSRTTKENAENSLLILRAADAKRVALVTSWYHSRRALACFRHKAPEIEFYSFPVQSNLKWGDWFHGPVRSEVAREYGKILGYAACYGIWPWG